MKILDHLILIKLNPENPEFRCDLQDLKTYESNVKTLDVTIKDSIFEKVLELTKEDEVSCFIRNYEGHLIYLSDCITSYRDKFKATLENTLYSEYIRLLEQLSDLITSLLDFLNSYFTTYFDQDKEVPGTVKEKAKKRFALKIMEISQLGDFLHNKLLKTVLLPAFEFQKNDPENMATFRRIIYLEVLLSEVIAVLKNEDEEDVEDALKWKLIYLNFNSILFFCYIQKEMKETIRLQRENTEKIRILNWYAKQIKQAGEKTGFALNPQGRPIAVRLTNWIKEEISYIEKYPAINCEGASVEIPKIGKIPIEASVQQLGAIINMMIKLEVVPEEDRMDFVKAFTTLFRTRYATSISEHSLFNKSKTIESGAHNWLKEKLIEALNKLNKTNYISEE